MYCVVGCVAVAASSGRGGGVNGGSELRGESGPAHGWRG